MDVRTVGALRIPEELRGALRAAEHVVVLTGAGVSAESGLSTFRDRQTGLWERFKPEDLATAGAFERDPALVWGWYEWRRAQIARALPNSAHTAIKALGERVRLMTLATQNVDDLHERAGSTVVHHLHGTVADPFCSGCGRPFQAPQQRRDASGEQLHLEPPRCSDCGARIRPGVVWFGEMLPRREWDIVERAAMDCDLFISVGTSALVYPAASLMRRAIARRVTTVQINLAHTELDSRITFVLRGPAGSILPELVKCVYPDQ